jgi:hypothetical protein
MMGDDRRQRVAHLLYEGEVEVWAEDPEDGVTQLILRDGPADLGDDLGGFLAWLLGPGRANGTGRCRFAKRLRILVDDLEADEQVPERRSVEGDPSNTELANLIRTTRGIEHPPQLLASMRDQWQARYRRAVAETRTAYLMAATYELLAAQAERTPEEAR